MSDIRMREVAGQPKALNPVVLATFILFLRGKKKKKL